MSHRPIVIWNRYTEQEEHEQVYGDAAVRWQYQTVLGRLFSRWTAGSWFSKLYGAYNSSSISRHKIDPFIDQFKINMNEYKNPGFQSFNDFFIREFVPGARTFLTDAKKMPAFSEGRYLGFESLSMEQTYPVKGQDLSPDVILGGRKVAQPFQGGPLLISRLCPVDYHRFHYPDGGETQESFRIPGKLYSVNPVALASNSQIFAVNERVVSILQTENFGKLAYVEVGAICVGKIVQTHPSEGAFERGAEKGYFLFGGSTVILFGEPGKWTPSADILEKTRQKQEVYIQLGDEVALSN